MVPAWSPECTGEYWQIEVTERGERFGMLCQTGACTENFQLLSGLATFLSPNENENFCSQKEDGNSRYCKQLSNMV